MSTARVVTVASVAGVAAASVVLGVYFGLASQSNANQVRGYQANNSSTECSHVTSANATLCTNWNNALNAATRDTVVSDGFYVASGLLAAGAVALWFLWPRGSANEPAASTAVVVPVVGPGGVGMSAVVRF